MIVARSRAFLNASRHEDYGVAQLEALAAGTPVVTVPTPGQFEALPLLRELAPELVTDAIDAPQLATALCTALSWSDAQRREYAGQAQEKLAPYRPEALRSVMSTAILPALL
jgi:glycosyltransferase involved in cell wall biosynthesis